MPEGWAWCRLPEIAKNIFAGGDKPNICEKIKTNECTIPIFSNGIENNGLYGYTNKANVDNPSITISARGTIGFTCVREEPFMPIVRLITITPDNRINLYYLKSVIDSLLVVGEGSSIPQLTVPTIKEFLLPLPPENEQNSIVETITSIFENIDSLDKDKDDLQTIINQTKSKILDLAIHGKLVPQDPNDEPAEDLLKCIATSDNRPYKKFEEEEPFEIPSNWSWCFLGDICSKIKRGKSPKYVDKSTIMAFAQKCNQKDGPTSLDKALYIDETTLKKYPEEEKMQFNDIVINSTGTGTLGRVGIFNCSIPNDVNAVYPDSHVTTVRILPEIDKLYCYYFIKTKQSYLETMGEGSTNQKELKPDTISSLYFPLPPYPEQKRIVSKIEELFKNLDEILQNLLA